jgi:hypothetical protein
MTQEATWDYVFAWKNTPEREKLFGKRCRVLSTGSRLRSILIEFQDGQRVVVSQRSIRRAV